MVMWIGNDVAVFGPGHAVAVVRRTRDLECHYDCKVPEAVDLHSQSVLTSWNPLTHYQMNRITCTQWEKLTFRKPEVGKTPTISVTPESHHHSVWTVQWPVDFRRLTESVYLTISEVL